jgi:mRNA interferase RelE/StbE
MSYEALILRRAWRELADLPRAHYARERDAVAALADNLRPPGCKKLVGRDGWRISSGDYRVLYETDDTQEKVTVLYIGRRRDVYS